MTSFDSSVTMQVLIPAGMPAEGVWNALVHFHNVSPVSLISSPAGTVALVPSCYRQTLLARSRKKVPFYMIVDANKEEMHRCGFTYIFREDHPMHFVAVQNFAPFVAPRPPPQQPLPALKAPPQQVQIVEAEQTCAVPMSEAQAGVRIALCLAIRRARRLATATKAAVESKDIAEKETLKATRKLRKLKSKHEKLKEEASEDRESKENLLKSLQTVLNERDQAITERDAVQRAYEEIKALPVATAVETSSGDEIQNADSVKTKQNAKATKALRSLKNYRNMHQLVSFLAIHNKTLKACVESTMKDQRSAEKAMDRLQQDYNRLEENHIKKESRFKKTISTMELRINEVRRSKARDSICCRLAVQLGVANDTELEEAITILLSVADEFGDEKKPPLAACIQFMQDLLNLAGKGRKNINGVPHIYCLYDYVKSFNEGRNLIDSLGLFRRAMELKNCDTLSKACLLLTQEGLNIQIGEYDATLADKPFSLEWTKNEKRDAFHYCMYKKSGPVKHKACVFEIMLTLQDREPLSLSEAAAMSSSIFNSVTRKLKADKKRVTHDQLLRLVRETCQLGWESRPYVIRCNKYAHALVAKRSMYDKPMWHLAGVELKNPETSIQLLTTMSFTFPHLEQLYKELVEAEGKYLADKHAMTIAALHEPLKNAELPWVTVEAYILTSSTKKLWDIVKDGSIEEAKRIFVHIFGCFSVGEAEITHMKKLMRDYCAARESYQAGHLPQIIVVDAKLKVNVTGDNWEKSVAEQLGYCQDDEFHTYADDYLHHIWTWVMKHRCFMHSDWRVSVRDSRMSSSKKIESTVLESHVSALKDKDSESPPKKMKKRKKRKKKKSRKEETSESNREVVCNTIENFIAAVNKGMASFEEEGLMSHDDIASLRHTTELMNSKVKKVKNSSWPQERKDSVDETLDLDSIDEALHLCNTTVGDAFL